MKGEPLVKRRGTVPTFQLFAHALQDKFLEKLRPSLLPTNELPCPRRYSDNLGKGVGLLVPGVVVLGVGVTLSIVDLSRRRKATLLSER